MEKDNKSQYAKYAAYLLFAAAVMSLPTVFRQVRNLMVTTHIMALMWLLKNLAMLGGEVWLGLNLMQGKRDKSVFQAIAVIAAAMVADFIMGFDPATGVYPLYMYGYYGRPGLGVSLLVVLPYLAEVAAYVLLALSAYFVLNTEDEQRQELVKKLWFLPPALHIAMLPLGLLAMFLVGAGAYIFYSGTVGFLRFLVRGAAMLAVMSWLAFPEGMNERRGDGYMGMVPHLLLCVFTLGIYQLVWISRVTKYLNARTDTEPAMVPWHQVVASMFVPFYMTYWTYKSAQRLDAVAREKSVKANLTMPCTVLKIFSMGNVILPSIFMQDKMNTLALLESGAIAPNAPSTF